MNKDDIIRMAREAGLGEDLWLTDDTDLPQTLRFAALVAAHEREANCACIGRIAAIVADPIDRARLYEAMSSIRARGQA